MLLIFIFLRFLARFLCARTYACIPINAKIFAFVYFDENFFLYSSTFGFKGFLACPSRLP